LPDQKDSAHWKDIIIVNSEYDRKLAIDKEIASEEKIIKIYNGIDPTKLTFLSREDARKAIAPSIKYPSPAKATVARQVLSINNTILIGTVTNLYATKGIEYLIAAAHNLYLILNTRYLVRFVVIGEGPERKKLESLIKKYNLGDKFFLLGRIPKASKYLKAFDVFVLPSVKEGMPWVLLDAMAAKVPIIATNTGAIPEILEDEKEGLLVPTKNSSTLAKKIAVLIQDQDLQNRIIENACKKLSKFSQDTMLKESKIIIDESR